MTETARPSASSLSTASFALGYRPWLDGIRALAVTAVILFHEPIERGIPYAWGGTFGVDVFFVISGFLITCILLKEIGRRGSVDLKGFYERRARRLFPALAVLLGASLLLVVVDHHSYGAGKTVEHVGVAALYVGNWFQAFKTIDLDFLRHTWSLSIEEQFYICWPLMLMAFLRRGITGKRLVGVLVGLTVLSALLQEYFNRHSVERGYYGTDTRAHGLLLGCALGVAVSQGLLPDGVVYRRVRAGLAILGAIALPVMVFHPVLTPSTTLMYDLSELATAAIILQLIATPEGFFHKALSIGPLRYLGRISYGIYLWEPFVAHVATAKRMHIHGWTQETVAHVVIALALAAGSYALIEKRFLLRNRAESPRDEGGAAPPAEVARA